MGKPFKILLGCAGVALIAIIAACAAMMYCSGAADSSSPAAVSFNVSKGEGAADIAKNLKSRGLVRSSSAFLYYAAADGRLLRFMPGEYSISKSMTPRRIAAELAKKPIELVTRVTLLEGWPSARYAAELEEKGLCASDEFMSIVRNPAQHRIGFKGYDIQNLEGYLFPDTYDFKPDTGCVEIVKRLVERFTEKFTSDYLSGARGHGLSLPQAVVLASLIEKEAERDDERRRIAGVIFNRLRAGMKLQVDATYKYRDGAWGADVVRGGAGSDPAYDTYSIDGLPPGPICNPGEASLAAAANPDTAVKDYYYVTKEDGSGGHYFSETLEGHNNNINASRENRRRRNGGAQN